MSNHYAQSPICAYKSNRIIEDKASPFAAQRGIHKSVWEDTASRLISMQFHARRILASKKQHKHDMSIQKIVRTQVTAITFPLTLAVNPGCG